MSLDLLMVLVMKDVKTDLRIRVQRSVCDALKLHRETEPQLYTMCCSQKCFPSLRTNKRQVKHVNLGPDKLIGCNACSWLQL